MSDWTHDPLDTPITVNPLSLFADPLVIPPYQRPLAWGNDESKLFLTDLITASEDRVSKYSLGVIYVCANKSGQTIIIDGQQRLTSIACLLIAIRNLCDDLTISRPTGVETVLEAGSGLFKISFWDNVNDHIKPLILDRPPKKTRSDNRTEYLNDNKSTLAVNELQILSSLCEITTSFEKSLLERVGKKTNTEQEQFLRELVTFIGSGVTLIKISLKSEDEGTRFFENLNNRGIPLTDFDVIRNHIYRKAPPSDKARLAQKFNEIIYSSACASWCKNPRDYSPIIKWCLQSDAITVGGGKHKTSFEAQKRIDELGGADKFLDSVSSKLDAFKQFWSVKSSHDVVAAGLERLNDAHQFEILAPLIIAIRQKTKNTANQRQVIFNAFLFVLRKTIFENEQATACAAVMSQIVREIHDAGSGDTISFPDIFNYDGTPGDLLAIIKKKRVDTKQYTAIASLLYLIEVHLLASTGTTPKKHGRDLNLEHIYPKKPTHQKVARKTSSSTFDPNLEFEGNNLQAARYAAKIDAHNENISRLGNFCLLDSTLNKRIQNACVYAKCFGFAPENYSGQHLRLVAEVLKHVTAQVNAMTAPKRLTWDSKLPHFDKYEKYLATQIANLFSRLDKTPELEKI